MRKFILTSFLVALCLVFGGCDSSKMANLQVEQKQKYPTVNVACDNNGTNAKANQALDEAIKAEIKAQGLQFGEDLQIKCAFTEYDEGNVALRNLVGFGAGRGKAVAQINLVDKYGKNVANFKVDSSVILDILEGGVNFEKKTAKIVVKKVKEDFYNGLLTPKPEEKK